MGIERNLSIIFMDGLKLTTNYLLQEGIAYLAGAGPRHPVIAVRGKR